MATPFWFNDPLVLFKEEHIFQLIPKHTMSRNERLNAIMRVVIILTVIGYAISHRIQLFYSAFIAVFINVFIWWNGADKDKSELKEGLEMIKQEQAMSNNKTLNLTVPTKENPMMNVRVNDIGDIPKRAPAMPSYDPTVEQAINEKTKDFVTEQFNNDPRMRDLLFGDLADTIQFDDSMRTFHTNPATTIPNDQGAFAEFCYGDKPSCKEGDPFACERGAFRKYPSV